MRYVIDIYYGTGDDVFGVQGDLRLADLLRVSLGTMYSFLRSRGWALIWAAPTTLYIYY